MTWPTSNLSDLATSIDYGVTASASFESVGPKFLRITDIQDGKVDWESVPYCSCSPRERAELQLADGDIVFARTGATTGKSFQIKRAPIASVFASYLIRVRPNEKVVSSYLAHFFQSSDYWRQVNKHLRGAGQPGVNSTSLKSLRVPIPPLSEQRRIASILDQADELRAKRRASLAQLDTLTQSLFVEIFGDPLANPKRIKTAKLGSLCTRITDGTHQPPKWSTAGHPFLFVSNIVTGEITWDTEKLISDETHAELTRRCPIELNDVLYSTVGSYGVPVIVRTKRKFAFQRHIAHLKPDHKLLDSEFLAAMLASPPLRRQADRAAKGVAQKTVNLSEIREFVVFEPPILLQREFARHVAAVEEHKAKQRASLAEMEELFTSLQYRAFSGGF